MPRLNILTLGSVAFMQPLGHEGFLSPREMNVSHFDEALRASHELADAEGLDRADGAPVSFLRRMDSLDVVKNARADSAGIAPAGLLTARVRKILATPYSGLDGLDASIIPQQQFTPVGEEYAEIVRTDWTGEVTALREGSNVPFVDISATPERFPVQHYVCGIRISMFERLSSINRLMNILSLKTSAARNAHARAMNSRVWNGDAASGLTGVLTHPYIPKRIGSVAYVDATAADTILGDLFDIVDFPADNTSDVGSATKLILASKLHRYLTRRRLTDTGMSLLKYFREQRPEVQIVSAHSLNDKGPNGEHGIVGYNAQDGDSLFHDLVQPTTFLAPQRDGFKDVIYVYTSDAGVQAFNAFQDIIHWVPAS